MSIYNALFDPCSPRLSKEKICELDRTEPGHGGRAFVSAVRSYRCGEALWSSCFMPGMARSAGSGTCEDSSQSD
jgi:hypothetical protein